MSAPKRISALVAVALLAAACSSSKPSASSPTTSAGSTTPAASAAASTPAAAASTPATAASSAPATGASSDIAFNQANLAKLDAALKSAMSGKDLSKVNIAMVVNVAADYWKAGQVGFLKGCSDLGISGSKCTYFAPPNGKLTEQTSELETLESQGVSAYSISAIDPKSAAGTIHKDSSKGIFVLAVDSPLPGTDAAGLYLGTPNYDAGMAAGKAMVKALNGTGKVAILVGSLTALNAVQRIQGFTDAIKGTGISVVQKVNDNLSASTATSDAETILANNPDVTGLYGVYSYDGPALAQAVKSANKTASVHIVSDDSDAQTLGFINDGTISATIVQMPYQQGYTGAFIMAAMNVLGKDATMAIVKPYLSSDGSTLSSGVGTLNKDDLSDYQALQQSLGIS
ncbi:MAG: substrate-binding domain-containing protein [Acidothermaceae bacterium]